VVKVCPNLTEFDCWHCEWLTDATLAVVAKNCPQLRELTLCCCCCCVTTDGVREIVTKLGNSLQAVDLGGCHQLGDEGVLALLEHCPLLERFVTPLAVSGAAVAKLKESCVTLKVPKWCHISLHPCCCTGQHGS
jgi:F-box and leucine-rich repeat protein GRR1